MRWLNCHNLTLKSRMKAQKYQIAMPVTDNHLAIWGRGNGAGPMTLEKYCCIVHVQSRPAPFLEVLLTTPTSHGRHWMKGRSPWHFYVCIEIQCHKGDINLKQDLVVPGLMHLRIRCSFHSNGL